MPRAERKRLWTTVACVIILGALCGVVAVWVSFTHAYWRSLKDAERAYLGSRGGMALDPDSLAFKTWGLIDGMTEKQVDERLYSAAEVIRGMPQQSPPWHGYVNIYEFNFGDVWRTPVSGARTYLIRESLWVYFDSEGNARRIMRTVFKHREYHEPEWIDLGTGRISRSWQP